MVKVNREWDNELCRGYKVETETGTYTATWQKKRNTVLFGQPNTYGVMFTPVGTAATSQKAIATIKKVARSL